MHILAKYRLQIKVFWIMTCNPPIIITLTDNNPGCTFFVSRFMYFPMENHSLPLGRNVLIYWHRFCYSKDLFLRLTWFTVEKLLNVRFVERSDNTSWNTDIAFIVFFLIYIELWENVSLLLVVCWKICSRSFKGYIW